MINSISFYIFVRWQSYCNKIERFNESLIFYDAPVAMTLAKFALSRAFGHIVGVAKGRPRVSLTNSLQQSPTLWGGVYILTIRWLWASCPCLLYWQHYSGHTYACSRGILSCWWFPCRWSSATSSASTLHPSAKGPLPCRPAGLSCRRGLVFSLTFRLLSGRRQPNYANQAAATANP